MKARDRIVIAIAAGALAAGTAFIVSELAPQNRDEAVREAKGVAFLPTGFGAEYDGAVARMTRLNHLLERRQADLFYARQGGGSRAEIALLLHEVGSLERAYRDAIVAMARAAR
jgi:hypothetical protein